MEDFKFVFGVVLAIIILCVMLYQLMMLSLKRAQKEEKKSKYLSMYILERKRAISIKGVSSNGLFFRKEKIKGFYYLRYPCKSIYKDSDISAIIEMDRQIGMTTTWADFDIKIEQYLIETEAGWYEMYVSEKEPHLVKDIAEIARSRNIESYIKLFIREEAELDLIEKDSYVFKLYSSKYRNRRFKPVSIDLHTLG